MIKAWGWVGLAELNLSFSRADNVGYW